MFWSGVILMLLFFSSSEQVLMVLCQEGSCTVLSLVAILLQCGPISLKQREKSLCIKMTGLKVSTHMYTHTYINAHPLRHVSNHMLTVCTTLCLNILNCLLWIWVPSWAMTWKGLVLQNKIWLVWIYKHVMYLCRVCSLLHFYVVARMSNLQPTRLDQDNECFHMAHQMHFKSIFNISITLWTFWFLYKGTEQSQQFYGKIKCYNYMHLFIKLRICPCKNLGK